ncbi:uncharacterized protein LOC142984196 isoform X2 [Anticarsia gemmatalis]
MKLLVFFTASLLLGLGSTAPASNATTNSDLVTVNDEFFDEQFVIVNAEHDIVQILVPLNALNFGEDSDEEENDGDSIIFYVLADNENGKRVDKGLFVRKNNTVTKLLDHGRDAAAANDDTKTAYFAAQDGIYSYNDKTNTAEKYGTITDSIISIAKVNGSDIIYILTEDHVLYKVTEEGTKKEKINDVVDAQQIVLDYENNLYYYSSDKRVFVLTSEGVFRIQGLPFNGSYLAIIKPPFIIESGIPVIIDSQTFIAYSNGTSELGEFVLESKPTAYAMEATLIQYYGYNKKIYEYNLLALLLGELLDDLKNYLEDKTDSLNDIATRSRGDLRA